MTYSGLELLRRLWHFLTPRRRWQLGGLLVCMLIGTALEMLSLGSVLPFLAVLIDPSQIFERPMLAKLVASFGVTSADALVTPLWAVFVGLALIAGAARLALLWATHHAAFVIGSDVSTEVYRRTLYQPFSVHVARSSSQLISGITKKVSQTTHMVQAVLTAITSTILSVGITAALVLVDPVIALLAAVVFGGAYLVVARVTRRRLLANGDRMKESSTRLVQALQEGIGGIRDVLLDGSQKAHVAAYRRVDRPFRSANASNGFIAASPRVLMEAFGIACIATLAYVLTQRQEGLGGFLPVLGVLAMGAQRLLPAFQQVYAGYAFFMGHQASVSDIIVLLEQPLSPEALEPPPPALDFSHEIRFEQVSFHYPGTDVQVLTDFDLVIPRGARVGFVGKTGGGKSTALDLLMGLLEPTSGRILVDGQPITGTHRRAWQRAIAHVPQSIFLSDATMAENIAFGIPRQKIDLPRVREAARIARIADFIESQPGGYDASVGERGVRLSGGQRQRIGIARALYRQASVLVFDEATSALDNATERELMESIEGLSRELTILMIAHRLTTVERCDVIVVLEQGRVLATGTYDELLESNETFRSLAMQPHSGEG
jgi:ABC-type multidrug transport system fused ATPase/permease subunit